jgi:uncharacterized protein YkwD
MAALRLAVPATALAALALALALPGTSAAQSACPGADDIPSAGHLRAARTATLCLLNEERAARGLKPLEASRKLRGAARGHSSDMVRDRYFDHASKDGSSPTDRIRRTGYLAHTGGRWRTGENIGWGAAELASPSRMVRAWMRSTQHRRNILDRRFRQIGIGIVPGAPEAVPGDLPAATYTTDFGRRG